MIIFNELYSAIQIRLSGDAPFVAACPNFGPHIKQDTPYPFTVFRVDGDNLGIKGEDAIEASLDFDCYTRHQGPSKSIEIAQLIKGLFDGLPVSSPSLDCFGCTFQRIDSFSEPDGMTYRTTITFTLLLAES